MTAFLAAVLLAGGTCVAARAADDDDVKAAAALLAPAASAAAAPAAPVFAPRPDHVVMGDTSTDSGKVFHGKGGPDKAGVPGGAVIINADGSRLEIAPTKRPEAAPPAAATAKLALPQLPLLDDPKSPPLERRRRAMRLLGGSSAAVLLLFFWARRRWRPNL
jgi:hypothetical protein